MNEIALSHEKREEEKSKKLMDSSKILVQKVEHELYLKNKEMLKINTMYGEDNESDIDGGGDTYNSQSSFFLPDWSPTSNQHNHNNNKNKNYKKREKNEKIETNDFKRKSHLQNYTPVLQQKHNLDNYDETSSFVNGDNRQHNLNHENDNYPPIPNKNKYKRKFHHVEYGRKKGHRGYKSLPSLSLYQNYKKIWSQSLRPGNSHNHIRNKDRRRIRSNRSGKRKGKKKSALNLHRQGWNNCICWFN